jgi:anti-sigma factor RsiW
MNAEFQLKLQAHLDGELSAREAREIEAALAADAEARALLAELRNTHGALAGFESEIKLPETREFYWSKIQREIQRQERAQPARPSAWPTWRRFLVPSGAFAALAIAGLLAGHQMGWLRGGARSPQIETFLADSGAMTYRDELERTTLVWFSYPAENEFADSSAEDTIE